MYKLFSWGAAVFWMAVIFYFSHQPSGASNELSFSVLKGLGTFMEEVTPFSELDLEGFHNFIRKSAHFFVYLLLGVLLFHALRVSKVYRHRSIVFALLICVLYAVSDEIHQLFIPGRSGEIRDVLIDSIGASTGIGVFYVVEKLRRSRLAEQGGRSCE